MVRGSLKGKDGRFAHPKVDHAIAIRECEDESSSFEALDRDDIARGRQCCHLGAISHQGNEQDMSEVVPGAPVPEYSGNSVDNAPSGGAPTSSTPNGDAPAQRPALSPESTAAIAAAKKRRRGRRGGRNRNRTSASGTRTQAANSNMAHNDSVQDDENDTDDLGGENETLTTVRVQQPPRVQINLANCQTRQLRVE